MPEQKNERDPIPQPSAEKMLCGLCGELGKLGAGNESGFHVVCSREGRWCCQTSNYAKESDAVAAWERFHDYD